ncbi:hypothetical protein RSOLAG1IB_11982 [Rhizoctonia solani AG-1 IB]|uniref:Uncharacterized protein n=1 Tax=Thanatephorus cucumeris (strain AG1-IB / isolate 7/3/14) TaxID=1108050 RepID=A0A0B7FIF5_THACB|nr:hypothetical protein RSOLAG1IB_11982 [Rhizoctonia solani AG-1 IB]
MWFSVSHFPTSTFVSAVEAERTLGHVGKSKNQRPNHETIDDDIHKIYRGMRGCRMIGHIYTSSQVVDHRC